MNQSLKQFSEELAKEFKAKMASTETADFVTQTKSAGADRSFEVVMSTSDEDRQGDSLEQSGWDLKYYNLNPVVLFAHDYSSFPIGIVDDIEIQGTKTIAKGHFAPQGINAAADLACALYQEKILRAVSPGYIQNEDGSRELLEVSFCPVPAGRYALSMRQVSRLGVSTTELITKGFFIQKAEQIGDHCELEDGTPGVLAEDEDNPGALVCVPPEGGKGQNKSKTEMDNELTKALKAEHGRHGATIAKHIDEFTEKAMPNEDGESEHTKAISEFGEKMEAEQKEHLEKCMKAVDDHAYDIDPESKKGMKGIDEFKTAIETEHVKHVKACKKAISEFKKDWPDGDPKENKDKCEKAIDIFTKAHSDELDRHEKAHMDLCEAEMPKESAEEKAASETKEKGAVAEELQEDKETQQKYQKLDRAFDIFYAFTAAYLDEATPVADFEKLLDEAVAMMKNLEAKAATEILQKKIETKAGRRLSAKTKEKLESVVKAIEDHHADHGESTKSITDALKAVIGDEGERGEEPKADEKSTTAPKERSKPVGESPSKSAAALELEAYLFAQKLLREVKNGAEKGLHSIKTTLREKYSDRI